MKICEFFETLYDYDHSAYGNLKVMWECMLQYPSYPLFHHEENGIWEVGDRIVGIVHLSGPWLGEVNIDIHPNYVELYEEMLSYAEKRFAGTNREGKRYIRTRSGKTLSQMSEVLARQDYTRCEGGRLYKRDVSAMMETPDLAKQFQVKTLSEVYDFTKLNRLLWKALNYAGEPPAYDDDVYLPIKQAWFDYQKEISTVILAPDGSYAGFCGLWYDKDTQAAYIEPLVRDSLYKNQGIGYALMYETLKRCKELNVESLFAVPDESAVDFYTKAGFRHNVNQDYWIKKWST